MKRLVVVLLAAGLPTIAIAQSGSDAEFRRRIISPWGISNQRGTDAFAETLLSPKDRKQLTYWFYQQEVLGNLAAEKSSQDFTKLAGYGVKGVGYTIGGLGSVVGGASATANPLAGGLVSVGTAVVGGYAQDYGSYLIAEADQKVATRIAISLNQRFNGVIRPNGQLNVNVLRNIGDYAIGQLLNDPAFIEEVGNPAILADLKGSVTISMLEASLKDTRNLRVGVGQLDAQIKELDKGYKALRRLQTTSLQQIRNNGASLGRVETRVETTSVLVSSLVSSTLPPAQVLELARANLLQLGANEVLTLERAATAQALRRDFDNAASVFSSVAVGLNALNVDAEVVDATSKFGGLLTAGGAFAAAISLGEPLSIFNSGAGLLGAVSSMFGRKSGDGTQKLLGQILKELRGLSEQIQENHTQQMEVLRKIAIKIDDLEDTINRRFAEIGLDVALLQVDTRELLYEDVRTCERLVDEFFLADTQALFQRGPIGFAIWFQSDNRAQDYARCLNGLMARQRITSEIQFSGMLRADSVEQDEAGASVADRRSAVRRVEQRILQPTVSYLRRYLESNDGEKIAKQIFLPTPELCDVLFTYATTRLRICKDKKLDWPSSRLKFSQLNAGQGTLLSTSTALRLSKLTRVVSPWNGVIWERTSAAAPRVISEEEIRDLSRRSMSRRTRHLLSLNGAADTLDLNIAQAQIIAGLPAVPMAAQVVDEVIIPAYAKARLLQTPEELNKLMAAPPPYRGRTGPNCSLPALMQNGDARAWNTLCAMEANPTFARNVVRAVLARRLDKRNISIETWRRAIRSPFSGAMLDVLGHDVILADAAANLPNSTFGAWAIELPRVYSDPLVAPPEAGAPVRDVSCWEPTSVTRLFNDKGEIDLKADYYSKKESGRCVLLDPFNSESFTAMSFATRFHALLSERALVIGQLRELCSANTSYPEPYCSFNERLPPEQVANRPRGAVTVRLTGAGASQRR